MEELIWTLIRRGLIAAGGGLVGSGYASADEITLISGGVVTVLATAWSIWNKYRNKKVA